MPEKCKRYSVIWLVKRWELPRHHDSVCRYVLMLYKWVARIIFAETIHNIYNVTTHGRGTWQGSKDDAFITETYYPLGCFVISISEEYLGNM